MRSIFHAHSVDPATVTPADLAEVYAELDLRTDRPGPAGFFQSGATYSRERPGGTDVFHVAAVAWWNDAPVALGYAPVNLGGRRTWELMLQGEWDWARGWNVDPSASPMITTEGARP